MEQDRDALLAELAPVHAPDVSWIPAPGWWFVLFALALLLFVVYRWYRYRQARFWQREAITELQNLRQGIASQPVSRTLSGASSLARRVALVANPREEVAVLQGQAWLNRLDELCAQPLFSTGFGRLLEAGPYQRMPEVSDHDLSSLLDAMEILIHAVAQGPAKRSS